MNERQQAFLEAGVMLRILSLQFAELPNGADVCLECAKELEEYAKLVHTITELRSGRGSYSVNENRIHFNLPEIDYTSGFPRK